MKAGKATRAGSLIPGVLTALLFSFNAAAQFGGGPPLPETVAPPQGFATSTEHYEFLYTLYDGGTTHTYESVLKWEGLWSAGGNNSGNNNK